MYICSMNDLSKEELEKLRLAQEAEKERVKGWWYVGKVFSSPIKTKKIYNYFVVR